MFHFLIRDAFPVFLVAILLFGSLPGYESGQDAGCHQEGHDQTQLGAGEDGGIRTHAKNRRGQR